MGSGSGYTVCRPEPPSRQYGPCGGHGSATVPATELNWDYQPGQNGCQGRDFRYGDGLEQSCLF